ncbi:unnamed protein product [Mytilus coruscus]|uniref:Integrase catalytic domain-containing protein n=1 Tax=Mytilus coruscus TaxID=42192 RepID=A0A6J7ZVM0_MYTCO|nr:unnamed protein product [Mytilus coruscus]
MVNADVICKVNSPTPWVNSLIVEKPNGKLMVCLDPKDLNSAIQRPHYPMRTLEDILPQLSNAHYYKKLDVRSGYLTNSLDEPSSYFTTFNTPYGIYRFKRLPFGLNCSQDLFQAKIDECYAEIDGVVAIVDDILVYGPVLLQDDKPVAYASKSLTTSEINYAQIEKEMYSIVLGCTRFHQYIYGRRIRVETLLVSIMKKSLLDAPARLQRMILRLQRYELDVVHLPGKCISVADILSRQFLSDTYPGLSDSFEAQVHIVFSSLPISDRKLEEIEKATLSDPQFDILKSVILEGWPQSRSECPTQMLEFWNHRDELSMNSGIIFKGHKIVIPTSLRALMLDKFHTGHMGVEKCIRRARDVLFWPKMSLDISDMVLKYLFCLERRNYIAKEPLEPHKIPQYPWQVVATNLFYWNNADYFVIVDYYSLYLEVHKLHGITSTIVINNLKGTFSRLSIPKTVVSDNGSQYSSQEFCEFAKK